MRRSRAAKGAASPTQAPVEGRAPRAAEKGEALKRIIPCVLLLCAAAAAARAQAGPAPAAAAAQAESHGLAVVKHGWSKERINWEADPFGGTVENFDDLRRRRADERRFERAKAAGNIGEANKIEREMRSEQVIKAQQTPPRPRYAFLYKATFRNESAKAVKEVDWDYVFLDAATREVLGRREFTAVEKIAPGKAKELAFFVPSPPTQKISAQALDRRERDGLAEQVVVVRVLYEDGTVWQRQQ